MSEYSTTGYYYEPGCLFQLFGDSSALFADEFQAADNASKQSKFANKLINKIGETQTINNHDDVLNNYETVTFPWSHVKVDDEKNIPIAIIPIQKNMEEQFTNVSTEKTTKKSPALFSKDDNYINLSPPSPIRRVKSVGNYLISLPKRVEQAKEREQREAEERLKLRKKFETLASGIEIVENGVKMVWTHDGRKVSEEQLAKMPARKSSYIPPYQYEEKNLTSKISVSKLAPSIDKKCQIFVEAKKEYLKKEQQERIEHQMWWKPKPKMSSTISGNGASTLPQSFVIQWPEYSNELENDDVILSVEYCRGCDLHSQTTRHNESQYYRKAIQIASLLSECIGNYAVRLKVLLKPISLPQFKLIKQSDGTYKKIRNKKGAVGSTSSHHDKQNEHKKPIGPDTSHRVGAFEIQLAVKDHSKLITHILHSKIHSGNWPQIGTLCELSENILDHIGISRLERPLRSDEFNSITGTKPIFDGRFRKKVWESPKAENRSRENVQGSGKELSTIFLTNMSAIQSQQLIGSSKVIKSEQEDERPETSSKISPIIINYHDNKDHDHDQSKITESEIIKNESKEILQSTSLPFITTTITTTTTTTTTSPSSVKNIIDNNNQNDYPVSTLLSSSMNVPSIIVTSDQQLVDTAYHTTSIASTTLKSDIEHSSGRISNNSSSTSDFKDIVQQYSYMLSTSTTGKQGGGSANNIKLYQSDNNTEGRDTRLFPSENTPLKNITTIVTGRSEGTGSINLNPSPLLFSEMKTINIESNRQGTISTATVTSEPSLSLQQQETLPQSKSIITTSSDNNFAKPNAQPLLLLPHPLNAPSSPTSRKPLNDKDDTIDSLIEGNSQNKNNVQSIKESIPVVASSTISSSTSNNINKIKTINNDDISNAIIPNVIPTTNRVNFISIQKNEPEFRHSTSSSGNGSGNQMTVISTPAIQQRESKRGSINVSTSIIEAATKVSMATAPVIANDSRQVHLSSSIRRSSKDTTAATAARSGSIISVTSAKSTVSKSSLAPHNTSSGITTTTTTAAAADRRPSYGAPSRRGSGQKSLLLPSITPTNTTKSTDIITTPQNTTTTTTTTIIAARNSSVSSSTKRKLSINSQLNKILYDDDNLDSNEYADNSFEDDGDAGNATGATAAATAVAGGDQVDEDLYKLNLDDDSILGGGNYSDVEDSQESSDKSDIFKKYDMLMASRTR